MEIAATPALSTGGVLSLESANEKAGDHSAASLYLYDDTIFPLAAHLMPDKILFATDYPLITQRRFLKKVREAGLEEGELNRILGGNAERILEPLMTYPQVALL